MRYVCLLAVMLWFCPRRSLSAQDGAAIYKERCASCHDMPEGRAPALSAIKAMSGEAIYIALTSGAMKTQARGLVDARRSSRCWATSPRPEDRRRAAPVLTRTCKTDAPLHRPPSSPR